MPSAKAPASGSSSARVAGEAAITTHWSECPPTVYVWKLSLWPKKRMASHPGIQLDSTPRYESLSSSGSVLSPPRKRSRSLSWRSHARSGSASGVATRSRGSISTVPESKASHSSPTTTATVSAAAETVAVVVGELWEALDSGTVEMDPRDRVATPGAEPERAWERHERLLDLLRGGERTLPELERLSYRGVLSSWIPGWEAIRFLGQSESFHTYTVGGHSLQCVAMAASPATLAELDPLAGALAEGIQGTADYDSLLLACLLHDIGKGLDGEDHAEAGASHAARVTAGLALSSGAQELVAFLVEYH